MTHSWTKKSMAALGSVALVGSLGACAADTEDEDAGTDTAGQPTSDIRLQVPTPAGGGFGLAAQRIQPHFAEALGVDVEIAYNDEGGQEAATATYIANTRDSCEDVLIMGTPMLQLGTMTNPDLGVHPEDLYPLGAFTQEPSAVMVGESSGYNSMEELIDDASQRPGEVNAAVGSVTDIAHLGLLQIEEATGAEFNKVFYGGGSPARDALVQGEADLNHGGVYNSQGIADSATFLGVQTDENEWPDLTDDAPTLNDALDTDLPESVARYALFVTEECYSTNSDEYDYLAAAMDEAVNSTGYQEDVEAEGLEGQFAWISGQEYFDEYIANSDETYGEAIDQIMAVLDEES